MTYLFGKSAESAWLILILSAKEKGEFVLYELLLQGVKIQQSNYYLLCAIGFIRVGTQRNSHKYQAIYLNRFFKSSSRWHEENLVKVV